MQPPELFTAVEAAAFLKVAPATLRRAACRGELQATRLGYRTVRYTAEALCEYVERKRRGRGRSRPQAAQREEVTPTYDVKPTNSRIRRAKENT